MRPHEQIPIILRLAHLSHFFPPPFFSLSLSPSLPSLSLSLRSNIYSIKSHRSSVTFFNFISSSCFPFFLSLLSLLPSHFLYIFYGTLTEKQRGGGVGLCKRTTARSGICPEFQQLLPAFLTGEKKKKRFILLLPRKVSPGRARKSVFPAAKFIGHPSSLILQDLRQIGIGIY